MIVVNVEGGRNNSCHAPEYSSFNMYLLSSNVHSFILHEEYSFKFEEGVLSSFQCDIDSTYMTYLKVHLTIRVIHQAKLLILSTLFQQVRLWTNLFI